MSHSSPCLKTRLPATHGGDNILEFFKINSAKPEFKLFNGLVARPIEEREDGFVEVYIPAMDSFLLLLPDELEEDG